jgi:hypothetical protein
MLGWPRMTHYCPHGMSRAPAPSALCGLPLLHLSRPRVHCAVSPERMPSPPSPRPLIPSSPSRPHPPACSKPCKVAYRWTEKGSKVRVSKRSGNVIPYPKLEERYTPPVRPTEPGACVRADVAAGACCCLHGLCWR